MVLLNEQRHDPGRSIGLNFDLSLNAEYHPLVAQLREEALRRHELRRRQSTIAKIDDALSCILANLLNARRISTECYVALSMRPANYTRTRYRQRGLSFENLRRSLDYLRETDPPFIDHHAGFYDRRGRHPIGRVTRIRATTRLVDRLLRNGGNGNDNNRVREEGENNEVVMNQANGNALPITGRISLIPIPSSDVIRLRDADGELVDYEDADSTRAMRNRLAQWNEFIVSHHWIDLLLPDAEIESLYTRHQPETEQAAYGGEQDPSFVDFTQLRLHRVFNDGSFDLGGRLYGGWWQQVPSAFRRYLTINGVPTRELDYSNLHAAMLYAQAGLPLVEDAYTLPDVAPQYRGLVKTTFFKLINARGGQRIRPPARGALPPGFTWAQLQEAIREKHRPIARYLNSGIGLQLQRIDAGIAEDVMLAMMGQDCLVLPIHDSFITYIGSDEVLMAQMRRAYRDRMQAEIGVDPDLTFLDLQVLNEEGGPDIQFLVEQMQEQPGYESYRQRQGEFLRTRNPAWHARFGDQRIG